MGWLKKLDGFAGDCREVRPRCPRKNLAGEKGSRALQGKRAYGVESKNRRVIRRARPTAQLSGNNVICASSMRDATNGTSFPRPRVWKEKKQDATLGTVSVVRLQSACIPHP